MFVCRRRRRRWLVVFLGSGREVDPKVFSIFFLILWHPPSKSMIHPTMTQLAVQTEYNDRFTHSGATIEGYINIRWWILSLPVVVEVVFFFCTVSGGEIRRLLPENACFHKTAYRIRGIDTLQSRRV